MANKMYIDQLFKLFVNFKIKYGLWNIIYKV